jgi:hypothetical protein
MSEAAWLELRAELGSIIGISELKKSIQGAAVCRRFAVM